MDARQRIEMAWGGVCGTSGYGFIMTTLHVSSDLMKFGIAMITAFMAGVIGYFGNQIGKHINLKFKTWKNAKRKPTPIDTIDEGNDL